MAHKFSWNPRTRSRTKAINCFISDGKKLLIPNLSSKKSYEVAHSEKKCFNNETSTSISDEIGHQSGNGDVENFSHGIKEKLSIDIHLRLL